MLTRDVVKIFGLERKMGIGCDYCQEPAVVTMHGYGDSKNGGCNWCADCAMQLVRKIMEDLCELLTKGGRHG